MYLILCKRRCFLSHPQIKMASVPLKSTELCSDASTLLVYLFWNEINHHSTKIFYNIHENFSKLKKHSYFDSKNYMNNNKKRKKTSIYKQAQIKIISTFKNKNTVQVRSLKRIKQKYQNIH